MYPLKPFIFSLFFIAIFVPLIYSNYFEKSMVLMKRWNKHVDNVITQPPHDDFSHYLQYTAKQAVNCFDILWQKHSKLLFHGKKSMKLHFIFIGDSRIRQHFYSFLKVIPNYDQTIRPSISVHRSPHFHGDSIDVVSNVLRLRVTFQWRPTINDTVTETLLQWTKSAEVKRPHFIFLGMATHFMLRMNNASFQLFREKIRELGSILEQLTNFSQVIWLNQYPIVEFYGDSDSHNTDIHSEKVHHYNNAVRKIFKRYNGIHIWDASNPLAEEYVRSCAIASERFTPVYFDCSDYIHTGYVALLQATKIFYSDICNF